MAWATEEQAELDLARSEVAPGGDQLAFHRSGDPASGANELRTGGAALLIAAASAAALRRRQQTAPVRRIHT